MKAGVIFKQAQNNHFLKYKTFQLEQLLQILIKYYIS